jgi:hypothetical protein
MVVKVLKLLTRVPKVILASATLPISDDSAFDREWLNNFPSGEEKTINPPCETLGITCMSMTGNIITYHDNTKTGVELIEKIEKIKNSSFLQKMYTGKIILKMIDRANELEIAITSPLEVFEHKLSNLTLANFRSYVYNILTCVSACPDDVVERFCHTLNDDDVVRVEDIIRTPYKFLGTTLIPSMTCEKLPVQLMGESGTNEQMYEYVKTYNNIYEKKKRHSNTRSNNKMAAEYKAIDRKNFAEAKRVLENKVINGEIQLQRAGVSIPYRFIRKVTDTDIYDRIGLSQGDQHDLTYAGKVDRANIYGCVFYNGGCDRYSQNVLKQLLSSNSQYHPAIVGMNSCVGVNFPFSNGIGPRKYCESVTPSTIVQLIGRLVRLGKETRSGNFYLHESGVDKLVHFSTHGPVDEARCLEELYEIDQEETLDDLFDGF